MGLVPPTPGLLLPEFGVEPTPLFVLDPNGDPVPMPFPVPVPPFPVPAGFAPPAAPEDNPPAIN